MAPRRVHHDALPPRIARVPARSSRSTCRPRIELRLLILLAVFAALFAPTAADTADASSRIRVLSGSSFRAFSNRFRRHLRDKHECLAFHEGGAWWRYEWCVGRHVRQFHNATLASEWSIVLGRFSTTTSNAVRIERASPSDVDAQRDPAMRGYVATQSYDHGELCATGEKLRSVNLTYKCCVLRANETYIEAVDEPTPCSYALSVCTPVACGLLRHDQYAYGVSPHVDETERRVLLQTVQDMFYHAYHGYMDHAFPLDALRPLSCRGETFELGKIPMLTLIDTLDTLALMEDRVEFPRAVRLVVERATFDLDTEVSVFETTIRVLGGLLSAHLLARDAALRLFPGYDNELLTLAIDLGDRLLLAFNTTTGIPYGTVNLRRGVPLGETPIASTAGAGSLSMEFTMLSVLTGNATYANAARRAVRALYERRSRVGLLGKHIDTMTGEWTETSSGPGSNADSFYEYLWKMYATFNDREMLTMMDDVYDAAVACNRHGDWFTDVSMWSGCGHGNGVVFENLVAFWPGLEASMGHMDDAARSLNAFYRVWRDYGFVPEQFNVLTWKPVRGSARYPLRPELIESTFYLHEATGDPTWLRAGAHVVHSLEKHTKTKCGYASVRDVETKALEDNMPSFFLSETCKYLYLLFNTSHFVRNGNYVFTTEAHPFPILPTAVVEPMLLPTTDKPLVASSDRHRVCRRPAFWHAHGYALDYEGVVVEKTDRCANPTSSKPAPIEPKVDWLPLLEKQLRAALAKTSGDGNKDKDSAFLQHALEMDEHGFPDLSARGKSVPTDELLAQLSAKLRDGWGSKEEGEDEDDGPRSRLINGGPRLGLFRMDQGDATTRFTRQDTGEWLESTGVEDARFTVLSWLPERRGLREDSETVDADDELPLVLPHHHVYDFVDGRHFAPHRRVCSLHVDVDQKTENPYHKTSKSFSFSCASASFGAMPLDHGVQRLEDALMALAEPLDACVPLETASLEGKLAIVKRGTCFFETKVRNAVAAGAVGVVVVNNEDEDRVMVMSGADESLERDDDFQQSVAAPAIMIPRRAGEWLHRQLVVLGRRVNGAIELAVNEPKEADEYPRMDVGAGPLGRVQIWAPAWGVELTPVNKPNTQEVGSWLLEVIEARSPSPDPPRDP